MKKRPLSALGVAWFGAGLAGPAPAATVYDESVNGDLANTGGGPLAVLSLSAGGNDLLGTTGASASFVIDRDYVTIEVPVGLQLAALTVLPNTHVVGGDDFGQAFLGIQSGPAVTVSPVSGSPAGLLGYSHYNGNDAGSNILPRIGAGFGASGFSGPLGAGAYSLWIQDFNAGSSTYGFRFTLAPVPEPATWALMVLGGGLIAGAGIRRRRA